MLNAIKLDTSFFENTFRKKMDYSKYIQMKMEAANTYKSNWQARDASEVTLRKVFLAQTTCCEGSPAVRPNIHQGPVLNCCSPVSSNALYPKEVPSSTTPPTGGFSTDYALDQPVGRKAGNTVNNDSVWGTAGGVTLKSCDQISTILAIPANPVKGSQQNCCVSPAAVQRGYVQGVPVPYTGALGNIPTDGKGVAVKYPLYPS